MRHTRHRITVDTIGCHERGLSPGHRRPRIIVLLLSLTALGWAVVWPTPRLPATLNTAVGALPGPVMTVTQVERALALDPVGWDGRIVLVRGRAVRDMTWQAPDSLVAQLALVDAGRVSGTAPLVLGWGRPDPLLAALRRLPLAGSLMPRSQQPRWGATDIYRIQLHRLPGHPGTAGAVLLDAAPDGQ